MKIETVPEMHVQISYNTMLTISQLIETHLHMMSFSYPPV